MIHNDSFTLTKDDCIAYFKSQGMSLHEADDIEVVWMEGGIERAAVPLAGMHLVVRVNQPGLDQFILPFVPRSAESCLPSRQ